MGQSQPTSNAPMPEALVSAIPNLRAFAIALCRDASRADDLVQETLVKAWNNRDLYKEGTNLRAWLFTILRNTYFSEHRRLRYQASYREQVDTTKSWQHPEQEGHLDLQDFLEALAGLPPDQREALLLVGAEGFSYEEAAEISGCAVGTIKSRVNRARKRLSDTLQIAGSGEFSGDPKFESIVARAAAAARRL
jgi:RNA polymerase sigma-70 factor (ECF subfamily)